MSARIASPWDLVLYARAHLMRSEVLLLAHDEEAARDEFETAWQLMADARDAFLEAEIEAQKDDETE